MDRVPQIGTGRTLRGSWNRAQKLRLLPTYEDDARLTGRTPHRLTCILEHEGVLA